MSHNNDLTGTVYLRWLDEYRRSDPPFILRNRASMLAQMLFRCTCKSICLQPKGTKRGLFGSGGLSSLWHKASKIITADVFPNNIPLYNTKLGYNAPGTVGKWEVFDDNDYGGNSIGVYEDMKESRSLANHEICDLQEQQIRLYMKENGLSSIPGVINTNIGDGIGNNSKTYHTADLSFTRFSGNVHISSVVKEKNAVVGGFVAFKAKVNGPPIDLRDHRGLELILRTSRPLQSFTLNMGTYSLIEDDMYQVHVQLEGTARNDGTHHPDADSNSNNGMWKIIQIPFNSFFLTARGIAREQQRGNDSLQLESIGILFRDKFEHSEHNSNNGDSMDIENKESNGDFSLDIHSIIAVPDGIKF